MRRRRGAGTYYLTIGHKNRHTHVLRSSNGVCQEAVAVECCLGVVFLPSRACFLGELVRDWLLVEQIHHLEYADDADAGMCCPLTGEKGGTSTPELANSGALRCQEDKARSQTD